ncbi:response regulator transcription factor [Permianibacter sp. IMCC34836]|nr:response regulator transcription factor [Permianibacter fluminis]
MPVKALVIEDNRDLSANVVEFLSARGHQTQTAPDGITGLHLAACEDFDVIVMDLGLPGIDGLTLCERLRREARKDTPVVMLTAKDTLDDKLLGFGVGADDYLTKPFALAELEVRMQALVRRRRHSGIIDPVLKVGDLEFDTETLRANRAGTPIVLTPVGRRLLALLMRESPRVVTRERLIQEVWGEAPPDGDVLRAHLYALRRAVDHDFQPALIKTLHREGYRIAADD